MGGFQHAALRPKTKHRQHNTEDTAQIDYFRDRSSLKIRMRKHRI